MSARVILISSSHAAVYVWQGKQLHGPLEFAADEAGYAALKEHLAQDAGMVTDLLVDVIEEEFRTERVPHVAGSDQAGLLKRRLDQAFRLTPYRMAHIQNKLVDGKREDEALLSAITNVDLIVPWVKALTGSKVPLHAIYSVAQLYGELLKPLDVIEKRALLITRQQRGGMRQAFYFDQKLKLSRLSPAPSADPDRHADQLLAEVDKSQRYLTRLKLLGRDDMLVVHCVSAGAELAALRETCRDTTTLQFRFHELGALQLESGAAAAAAPLFCDTLFLHLLKRHTPPRDYALPVERRYEVYRRARAGLHGASAALVLTALAWTGMNLIDARLMREFNSSAGRISGDIKERYDHVMEELPKTPVSPQNLRTGVELAQGLLRQSSLPHPMLYALSAGLRDFPQVDVQSVEWVATSDPASVAFGNAAVALAVADPAPAGEASASTDLYQVAQVKGSLRAFDGDYRKAFEQVNRLVATLKQNVELQQVRAVELPLNTDPAVLLQGKTGVQEQNNTAAFVLQAVLKVKRDETR